VFLGEEESRVFVPHPVLHATFLSHAGVKSGSIHERNPRALWQGYNPGIRVQEIILGKLKRDFPGGAGDLNRSGWGK